MKTRAQKRKETLEQKIAPSASRTKKEVLQGKANALLASGKPEGKKIIKRDSSALKPRFSSSIKKNVVISEDPKKSKQKPNSFKKIEVEEGQERKSSLKKLSNFVNSKSKSKDKSKSKEKSFKRVSLSKQEVKTVNSNDFRQSGQPQQIQKPKNIKLKQNIPIDSYCSFANHGSYKVLEHGGKSYSVKLIQTLTQHNNGKYCILQIIQNINHRQSCYFYTRWGRVETPGQTSCLGPYSIAIAIKLYTSKFQEKHHRGGYRYVQYNSNKQLESKKSEENKAGQEKPKIKDQEGKLSKPVRRLIQLIFDMNMMTKQMVEIGYDSSQMSLAQLSKTTNVRQGYTILQSLMHELKSHNRKAIIEQLTKDFYFLIPHDFGFSKISNFLLDNQSKIKKKILMLEALTDIEIAISLLNNESNKKETQNVTEANYKKLHRQIKAIDRHLAQFQLINKYLQSTHATTHTSYTLQLEDLFELKSETEQASFSKNIDNRVLLWYGNRLSNYVGILSQGLKIAPYEAPVSSYMFGKGVYFSDMSSKSANNCYTSKQHSTGILLLCEVALGNSNQKLKADYFASNLPEGKHSTKGVGRTVPNPQNAVKLSDGVIVPMGPGQLANQRCQLLYNEYVVYNVSQIKIRYLLRVKFYYKKGSVGFGY